MNPQSTRDVLLCGLVLGSLIELGTVFGRFALGLRARRAAPLLRRLTLGVRIHHCYLGVACFALAPVLSAHGPPAMWLAAVGIALVLSDVAHHFLVLWPATGDHEFDLRYPT